MTSSAEEPWPVRVVSQKIGGWIARLGEVWVEGQLTEVSVRSATVYCTLRDPSADISLAVTCRRDVFEAAGKLTNGSRVIARTRPEFYPARGSLSLRAAEFRAVGIGELLARLEQLKKLLAAEGLFAAERKRPLPFLPHRVGLITGRNSAAERDVLLNARRRWAAVQFDVRNVPVQGATAVPEIIKTLRTLDADPEIDVIVLARGGGSVEDLLPFSDEALCRAVFASQTPVVSAIGHEPDTPIVDFVADVRCSTPTDAGKRVVPDFAEEVNRLRVARNRLASSIGNRIDREQQWLDGVRTRPVFADPSVLVTTRERELVELRERAQRRVTHLLAAACDELGHVAARLRAVSPQSTLDRGYAIVHNESGALVRAVADVKAGDGLHIRVADGEFAGTAT